MPRLKKASFVQWSTVSLGFAIAVDQGLVVPAIRRAGTQTAAELAEDVNRLIERARVQAATIAELQDYTVTVTNLASLATGIDSFTPIVNLPQVAILGMGRVEATR